MSGHNFTDRVRRVLQIAREEAQRRGHPKVDTGHLLLAIINDAESTGAQALTRVGVDVATVRQAIEDAMKGKATERVAGPDLPYSWAAKRVLELATSEARELRHDYTGTEHLLLAMLREEAGVLGLLRGEKSIATHALTSAGVTLAATRAAVASLLADEMPARPPRSTARRVATGYTFTDRVRKVLQLAREEAARLGHDFVGSEHIWLGLLREGEGVAAAVLANLNVDLAELQERIEARLVKGQAMVEGPDFPYTRPAKGVLELAISESRELHYAYIGTEHLLLGLLHDAKSIAGTALADLGVTLEHARAEMLRLVGSDTQARAQNRGRGEEIVTRMRALVAELHGTRAPDAERLGAIAAELNRLLDELAGMR